MLSRVATGKIYQEDFDNVTPWTLLSGTGSIAIVSGELKVTNPSSAYYYVNNISNLKNSFIQLRSKVTLAYGYMGPVGRAITVGQNIIYAYGHWGRTGAGGDYDILNQYLNSVLTALVSYSHSTSQRAVTSYYDVALWLNDGTYRMFYGCNQGGHYFSGTNCTQLGTAKTGFLCHAPAQYTWLSRYNIMTEKNITCSGLPLGWKFRVNQDNNFKATESGGTATVDCFYTSGGIVYQITFPVSTVEVLDGSDIVKDSLEIINDIWGGDTYLYTGTNSRMLRRRRLHGQGVL